MIEMKTTSASIKQHQVLSFFLLAYGVAWGVILVVASSKGFHANRFQLPDIMLMFLAMLLGPSLAGIVLTAVVDGKNGLRTLLSRMSH